MSSNTDKDIFHSVIRKHRTHLFVVIYSPQLLIVKLDTHFPDSQVYLNYLQGYSFSDFQAPTQISNEILDINTSTDSPQRLIIITISNKSAMFMLICLLPKVL